MDTIQDQKPQKQYTFIVFLKILVILAWFSGCTTLASERPSATNKTEPASVEKHLTYSDPQVQAVLALKPVKQRMNVLLWTDKKTYRIGDEIIFFFKTSQDSYLTVFDIGSSGNLRVIFPNQNHPNQLFKSGQTHRIPAAHSRFGIQVAGPSGLERIKVIATPEPWFSTSSNTAINFLNISRGETREGESLKSAIEKLKKRPWAEAQTEITIIENNRTQTPFGQERQVKPKPPEKPIDITGTPGRSPKVQLSEKQTNSRLPLEDPLN